MQAGGYFFITVQTRRFDIALLKLNDQPNGQGRASSDGLQDQAELCHRDFFGQVAVLELADSLGDLGLFLLGYGWTIDHGIHAGRYTMGDPDVIIINRIDPDCHKNKKECNEAN